MTNCENCNSECRWWLGGATTKCVLVFVENHPDGATLEECGQELRVTRERIRQIQAKAIRKLIVALPEVAPDLMRSNEAINRPPACPVCHAPLIPKKNLKRQPSRPAIYCSHKCRQKAYYLNNRDDVIAREREKRNGRYEDRKEVYEGHHEQGVAEEEVGGREEEGEGSEAEGTAGDRAQEIQGDRESDRLLHRGARRADGEDQDRSGGEADPTRCDAVGWIQGGGELRHDRRRDEAHLYPGGQRRSEAEGEDGDARGVGVEVAFGSDDWKAHMRERSRLRALGEDPDRGAL